MDYNTSEVSHFKENVKFKKIEESAFKDKNVIDLDYLEDERADEHDGL